MVLSGPWSPRLVQDYQILDRKTILYQYQATHSPECQIDRSHVVHRQRIILLPYDMR